MPVMAEQVWRHDQRWYQAAGMLGVTVLLGVGVFEAMRRLPWTHGQQTFGFHAQPATLEGVIVDLAMAETGLLKMTTMDGQDRQLSFSPETTAVFVPGAVLNPGHLRLGQHVQVTASLYGTRGVVRAIRIINKIP